MKRPLPALALLLAAPFVCGAQDIRPAQPVPVAPAQPVDPPSAPATPAPPPAIEKPAAPAIAPPPASPIAAPAATPVPLPPPPPQSARDIINGLSESQIDQAIQSIQTNFLDATRIDSKELRRSTLEGLIQRLAPGTAITTESAVLHASQPSPFLAEILDSRIGYVRLGALDSESLAQMDAAIANFNEKKLGAIILDLRASPPSSDFDVAADFARRFCPKGKLLYSIQKPSAKQERILTSNQDPAFPRILVVLTDENTSGAAEALAATLRLNAEAMIVGATTSGEAVEFSDVPLGDGRILRVAVAQVTLPESGPIFPAGVKPDIAAALPAKQQAEIFTLSAESGVSQFVFETERPHVNEAALVANTNPEADPSLALRHQQELWDSVLQRAVDLVTAISFYSDRKP